MGPFQLGLAEFMGLRLNEHALHTWDIDVALHPAVTVPADAVDLVIDNLGMIAGFVSKSDGEERVIKLKTTEPARAFALTVGPERASLAPSPDSAAADVELPAESFVRLVYGRLDPAHTPPGIESPELEQLRAIFPGV
jgi:MDMPI C-terminal domain